MVRATDEVSTTVHTIYMPVRSADIVWWTQTTRRTNDRCKGSPEGGSEAHCSSDVFSLSEMFDLTLEHLYGIPSGSKQQSALCSQVHGHTIDGLAETPDAYPFSQSTVQVSPVFEYAAEVLDPVQFGVQVREQGAKQVQ